MLKFFIFAAAAGSGTGIYLTHTRTPASKETIEIIPTGTATDTYKKTETAEIITKATQQTKILMDMETIASRASKSADYLMQKAEATLTTKQSELNTAKTRLNTTSKTIKELYESLKTLDAEFIQEVKDNMDQKLKISFNAQMNDFYTKQKTSYEKELSAVITNIKLFCTNPSSTTTPPTLANAYSDCKDSSESDLASTNLKAKGTELESKIEESIKSIATHAATTYAEVNTKKNARSAKLQEISTTTNEHNGHIRTIEIKEKLTQLAIQNLNRAHINYKSSKKNEEIAKLEHQKSQDLLDRWLKEPENT